MTVRYVDLEGDAGPSNLRAAMRPDVTKLVMIESPTNPLQRICDIRALATVAHEGGALLAIDNTMMSPLLQRPLELGADLIVHSATKFICGHADTMAGCVVVKDDAMAREMYFTQNAEGTGLAPFDCWLLLRGVKVRRPILSRGKGRAPPLDARCSDAIPAPAPPPPQLSPDHGHPS